MVQLTHGNSAGLPQEMRPEEEELILEGYISVRGDTGLSEYCRRKSDKDGLSITLMWNDEGRAIFARESIPRADLLND
jgi:hypothetical protein